MPPSLIITFLPEPLSFVTKDYIKLNIKTLTYRKQWRIVLVTEFLGVHYADKVHTWENDFNFSTPKEKKSIPE